MIGRYKYLARGAKAKQDCMVCGESFDVVSHGQKTCVKESCKVEMRRQNSARKTQARAKQRGVS